MMIQANSTATLLGLKYNEIMQIKDPQTLRNVLVTELFLQENPSTSENIFNSLPTLKIENKEEVSDPNNIQSSIPKLYSSLLSKSDSLQSILKILENVSPPQYLKESTSLLLKVNQQQPDLLIPSIDFLEQIPSELKTQAYPKALEVLQKMFNQVQLDLQNKSKPEGLGIKQEFVQSLRQMKQLLDFTQNAPLLNNLKEPFSPILTSPALPEKVLNLLLSSLKDQVPHQTEELFALTVFLKAGFKPEEYILAAAHENPVKTALVLIAAQKNEEIEVSAKPLQVLVKELRTHLLDKDAFLESLKVAVEKLKPNFPEEFTTDPLIKNILPANSQNNKIKVLQEGFIESTTTGDEKIPLQALSMEDGFIPPTQWIIQSSINQIALQGAYLMLRQFPAGLNAIKMEVKNSRNKSKSSFNIFALLTQSFLSSDIEDSKAEYRYPENIAFDRYQVQGPEREANSLLLGSLAFSLDAPVFLTQGFSGEKISAPEHFEFYFLMDWIHPDKRYSRKDFLTLSETEESKTLRLCIQQLNKEGLPAFENYQKAVKNFLNKIQKCIPEAKSSLREAETFLNQEVKKHFENKSNPEEKNQLLEAMPKGNLMASILRKTASLYEEGNQYGEALIHFAEASKGDSENQSVGKLDNLLQKLRKRFIETQSYASENWVKQAGLATHFIERYQTS